jgi:hypothetical protein
MLYMPNREAIVPLGQKSVFCVFFTSIERLIDKNNRTN